MAFKTWAFDTLGLIRLFMEIGEDNEASQALAMSCRFERKGQLRKHYRSEKGDLVDSLVYGVVRPEAD